MSADCVYLKKESVIYKENENEKTTKMAGMDICSSMPWWGV